MGIYWRMANIQQVFEHTFLSRTLRALRDHNEESSQCGRVVKSADNLELPYAEGAAIKRTKNK